VSENCAETRPSCQLASYGKAYRRLLMGTDTPYGDARPKNLVSIEVMAVILLKLGDQNGNPGLKRFGRP